MEFLETGSLTFQQTMLTMKLQKLDSEEEKKKAISEYLSNLDDYIVQNLDENFSWINVDGVFSLDALKGKIVLLDFWTYCCINCLHLIPEIDRLEERIDDERFCVVGVHSPKFENEKDEGNVRKAVGKFNIHHVCVNDPEKVLWRNIGCRGWPTVAVLGPKRNLLFYSLGGSKLEMAERIVAGALEHYEDELDDTPIPLVLDNSFDDNKLNFPTSLSVDCEKNILFVADSGNNRIIIADSKMNVMDIVGSPIGDSGLEDGDFHNCLFNNPQGLCYQNKKLYIADTDNHCIRLVDLETETVSTLSGTGERGTDYTGGKEIQELSSPWDVCYKDDNLFISMSGQHQIWRLDLSTNIAEVYSGTGSESHLNNQIKTACWAQPSGIIVVGDDLVICDAESSTVRAIDTITENTRTICGATKIEEDLAAFGDIDGVLHEAKLQHPLSSCVNENNEIFITDTYNHKIKQIDLENNSVSTLHIDDSFSEPSGITYLDGYLYISDTNNHTLKKINLETYVIESISPAFGNKIDSPYTNSHCNNGVCMDNSIPLFQMEPQYSTEHW